MRSPRAVRSLVSTFSCGLNCSKRPFLQRSRALLLSQHLHLNNLQAQHVDSGKSFGNFGSRFHYSTDVLRVRRYPKHLKGNLQIMKIESEYFKDLFTPELEALHKLFQKYGYEIRMAGGVVRDLLAGKKPTDVDFATTATPDEMKEIFEKEGVRMLNMKGEKHGTITARINDKENFEVTTLRIDVTTDGRHAEVQFTKNWELDAGRRDLTVNSMFLDFEGNVYDYFNGTEDLKNRVIRFVGEPSDRIQEDYLRILRYFRFYGRISPKPNEHESATLEAIRENMSGLKRISGERIWVELRKILTGNHAGPIMVTMMELGIGEFIGLPKDANIEEFQMLMNRLDQLKLEANPITLLSAFMRTEKEAKDLNARLKLSVYERDLCPFVIAHRGGKGDADSVRPYKELLLMTNQPTRPVLQQYIEEVLKYNGDVQLLEAFKMFNPPKFPVNGHMLMERQIKGKQITAVMTKLKERWIHADFQLTEEELLKMLPEIKAELSPPQK